MIYPAFPKPGDLIGICAPSQGVGHKLESFDCSLDILHQRGFRTKETASVRLNDARGGDAKTRGDELASLFSDIDVTMVMAAAGGDFLDEMLPYAGWDVLGKNPKWLMGFSDPTGLLYPLTTLYDIATLYGHNAGDFDLLGNNSRLPAKDRAYLEDALSILSGNLVTQASSKKHLALAPFLTEDLAFNTPTLYGSSEPLVRARGRCIGGCIDVLKDLLGTPYDGTQTFLNRYASDGIIWYFDNFSLSAEVFYRTLLQMKFAGWFNPSFTRAVLVGRTAFESSDTGMTYTQALSMALGDIPWICGMDIGHTIPHFTMINGAILSVICAHGAAQLRFELI